MILKRYDYDDKDLVPGMYESPHGEWVRYADVVADLDRLEKLLNEARVERDMIALKERHTGYNVEMAGRLASYEIARIRDLVDVIVRVGKIVGLDAAPNVVKDQLEGAVAELKARADTAIRILNGTDPSSR